MANDGMESITDHDFFELVYEIAFGEDAFYKEYSHKEVIEKLREISDSACDFEEISIYQKQTIDSLRATIAASVYTAKEKNNG